MQITLPISHEQPFSGLLQTGLYQPGRSMLCVSPHAAESGPHLNRLMPLATLHCSSRCVSVLPGQSASWVALLQKILFWQAVHATLRILMCVTDGSPRERSWQTVVQAAD